MNDLKPFPLSRECFEDRDDECISPACICACHIPDKDDTDDNA